MLFIPLEFPLGLTILAAPKRQVTECYRSKDITAVTLARLNMNFLPFQASGAWELCVWDSVTQLQNAKFPALIGSNPGRLACSWPAFLRKAISLGAAGLKYEV